MVSRICVADDGISKNKSLLLATHDVLDYFRDAVWEESWSQSCIIRNSQ